MNPSEKKKKTAGSLTQQLRDLAKSIDIKLGRPSPCCRENGLNLLIVKTADAVVKHC